VALQAVKVKLLSPKTEVQRSENAYVTIRGTRQAASEYVVILTAQALDKSKRTNRRGDLYPILSSCSARNCEKKRRALAATGFREGREW